MTGYDAKCGAQYYAKDPTELGLSVSAMVWRDHEILLMRRADNGHWGLPGGFVEVGESVSDAARREILEETGWSVELGALIGVYSDPETSVVDYSRVPTEGVQPGTAEGSSTASAAGDSGQENIRASRGRVQVVNLCFRAEAVAQGEPTTPEETLDLGFFPADGLPSPFVPIHRVRIGDGLAGRAEAFLR